jgi:hypothetical protein
MALPLEVLADLRLAVDGENINIQADGERIVVDLPSLRAGRRLLAAQPLSGSRRPQSTEQLHDALEIAGLTAEVRLQGDVIARIGAGAQPGRLGQLLRMGGIELRAAPSLRAAARRRPLTTALVVGGLAFVLGWLVVRLWRS